ncbi:hypothetical protein [Streptomyces lydicus]|uniref:hypothetical protein n=1 Tax=Streptomyces lydicus TaxID=47763 RepID=UPI0013DDB205|nr:hypothetical protein [Streptomyces lydicus]
MESVCWLLFAVAAPAVAMGIAYSDLVGTKAQRARRYEGILRSFDGRPEVKVRVTGTGLSAEQTAWIGHQYGYSVGHWETERHQPRYLVMRRMADSPSDAAGVPGAWNSQATPVSIDQVRQELRKAPDPVARRNQIFGLLVLGIVAGATAVSNYRSGGSYIAPALAAPVFFAGAATLRWYTRRVHRERQSPPDSGRQKW